MTNYHPPRQQTKREKGLEKHLGTQAYEQFVYHYNYQMNTYGKINYSQLAKAIGKGRGATYDYVEIHREEQTAKNQKEGLNSDVNQ